MFDEGTEFVQVINRYISSWTNKFYFYTKPVSKSPTEQKYSKLTADS